MEGNFLPAWVIPAIGGGLVTLVVTVIVFIIQNRRPLLSYHVNHERVGISTDDAVFGKVEVTVGGTVYPNLFMSQIWLRNTSVRDLKNLEIKVAIANQNTRIMSGQCWIENTLERPAYTMEYNAILNRLDEAIQKKPEDGQFDRQALADFNTWGAERHYRVPDLNRFQTVRFTYMTNTANPEPPPMLAVLCQNASVRVIEKPPFVAIYHLWGVPLAQAALTGIVLAIPAYALIISQASSAWLAAGLCMVFGLIANMPGAGLVRLYWWLRAKLVG